MAKGDVEARGFRRRFLKLHPTSGETGKKAREKAANEIQDFIARLKSMEAVEACLAVFLKVHATFGEARTDIAVLAVFQVLVYRLTSLIQDDLLRLTALRRRLNEDLQKEGLREVFDLLPPYRQQELLKRLDDFIAIEERAARKKKSLIDELRDAYKIRNAGRFPTLHQLYTFEALPDGAQKDRLKADFDARHGACETGWREVRRRFSATNLDAFLKSRKGFIDFLTLHRGTGLELYQLWHWMTEKMNVTLGPNDRWSNRVQRVPDSRLNAELYLLLAYALFLRGTADRNFPLNRAGFTRAEDQLFLGPLRREWYAADYDYALRQGFHSHPLFYRLAQANIGLYLYGESLGSHVSLARMNEAQQISKARAALDPADLPKQVVDLRGQSGPDFAKVVLKIDEELGLREGRFRIYYVAGPKQIYIEFPSLSNVLFQVTDTWLGDQYVSQTYDLIYDKTKHLADAIPFVFEVLGYLPTLVTGGLYAVAREVVVDRVVGAVLDEFGPSSTGGPGGVATIGAIIKTLRRKSPPNAAEVARLEKQLGRLGKPKIDPDVADNILSRDFLETGYDAATQTSAFDALTEAERARLAPLRSRAKELESRAAKLDLERDALYQQRQKRGIANKGIEAVDDPADADLIRRHRRAIDARDAAERRASEARAELKDALGETGLGPQARGTRFHLDVARHSDFTAFDVPGRRKAVLIDGVFGPYQTGPLISLASGKPDTLWKKFRIMFGGTGPGDTAKFKKTIEFLDGNRPGFKTRLPSAFDTHDHELELMTRIQLGVRNTGGAGQIGAPELRDYIERQIWDPKTRTIRLRNANKQEHAPGLSRYVSHLRGKLGLSEDDIRRHLLGKILDF
jgi:hypothetical protein